MMNHSAPDLHVSKSPTARVVKLEEGAWHLEIPANTGRGYRLAQLDDHASLRRGDFPWKPPLTLRLQARLSAEGLPGTWGFGLWNDPFSLMIANNRVVPRLPTLPDAAWFFHASPQNHLSFRDDLPANGFLAATFRSRKMPAILLALFLPVLALTLLPRTAEVVRRLLRRVIHQDASRLYTHVTGWHTYTIVWGSDQVRFSLDGMEIHQTNIAPHPPLSLVIWIDNQYAALPPGSRLTYGSLPNPEPAWLEIRDLKFLDHA